VCLGLQAEKLQIEVLHGSHVAWQEQKIPFPMGKEVLSCAKYFHCSCHATWLPCKTSVTNEVQLKMTRRRAFHYAEKLGIFFFEIKKNGLVEL